MKRAMFRELRPYSLDQLADGLDVDERQIKQIIEELLSRGLMKRKGTNSDDSERADIEESAADEVWQFRFVGMMLACERVIEVYPKYFKTRQPVPDEMRQILRVIRSLPKSMTVSVYDEGGQRQGDKLALMLELLDRYSEHGVYENYVDAREVNGAGTIDWNRTINEHLPFLSDGSPVYVEYKTRKNERDDSDYISRLHCAVLTECSQRIQEWGVGDLLSLDETWLSAEAIEDFGGDDILEWHFQRERGVQFVTWKQDVLSLMEGYLLSRDVDVDLNEVSCIGTTSFYHVWELACKVAFGDKLGVQLSSLGIPLAEPWQESKSETLLGIIPRPKWERPLSDGKYDSCADVDTLKPDTITFCGYGDSNIFCIYDAKYYVPIMGKKPKGQPGVESITKQFLYQSAYRRFVLDHGFDFVVNAFLVPTESENMRMVGRVSFPKVIASEKPPFSNFIYMWALPAAEIFDAYLHGRRIDGDGLREVWASELYFGEFSKNETDVR